jgi:hypothetical protein
VFRPPDAPPGPGHYGRPRRGGDDPDERGYGADSGHGGYADERRGHGRTADRPRYAADDDRGHGRYAAADDDRGYRPYTDDRYPDDDRGYGAGGTGGGKRRADVTAIDLGYTGRRARDDDAGAGEPDDDAEAVYPGYGWERERW